MELKLDSYIKDKTLVFTVTSNGYKYLTWNLWLLVAKLGTWKLCILCLDKESFDFFNRMANIPSRLFLMNGPQIQHITPTTYGSTAFKRMNRMKIDALCGLSQRTDIETLVYLDSDIAVFKDPLPYLKSRLEEQSLWFQCDENSEALACSDINRCGNPCTGLIAMRLDETTRPVFKNLYSIDSETWKTAVTDQDYIFNRLKQLQVGYKTLERGMFPNGVFINKYKESDPYLLHFNYMVGTQKQAVMKRKGCWLVPV
jgi:hypothetical protein